MKRTILTSLPALLLVACVTGGRPGEFVDQDFASRWGCDADSIKTAAEVAKQGLKASEGEP